ncbi:DUF3119 family protein [Synechococcus sp. Nb3U1]|uniref:DUF3119 family protein n=1 Tax=Synechococcus sp. Nb3U1 TaxID=1914529 RepID=UPI001F19162F|nr:DUF3119 family protein [Synechococcus sp. Nb3U1]MCF2970529.1 DUF3119 family protein [Synechococcus sp. Nb3U1]
MVKSDSAHLLTPDFRLSLAILALSVPLFWLSFWAALGVGLFGLFLVVQTALIGLAFTKTALQVYSGSKRIREFPYSEWRDWQIFWPALPILFFFRETQSIHFLPTLFNPAELQSCLEQRVGYLHPKQEPLTSATENSSGSPETAKSEQAPSSR